MRTRVKKKRQLVNKKNSSAKGNSKVMAPPESKEKVLSKLVESGKHDSKFDDLSRFVAKDFEDETPENDLQAKMGIGLSEKEEE